MVVSSRTIASATIAAMPPIDRRRFLQQTAAGVAAANAGWASSAASGVPLHAEISVPGVHAYSQRSLEAGASVDFRVSSDTPYEPKFLS